MEQDRKHLQARVAELENEIALLRSQHADLASREPSAASREDQASDALRISEERLGLALDVACGVGTWDWDIVRDRVYANQRFAEIFHVDPRRAAEGVSVSEFTNGIHQDDRARVIERIQRAVREKNDFSEEYRTVNKNGEVRWVHARGRCHGDAAGIPIHFPGVVFDITDRKQAEAENAEKARLTSLSADVGTALAQIPALRQALQHCAQAIVNHLNAAFARVWTLNEETKQLELQASAGLYTHLNGPHARVPVGAFKIGLIAQERQPHLTNDVANDPRVSDREWASREGMVSFAGYPLVVEDRLVGVLALFARHTLGQDVLNALASVSTSISLGIESKQVSASLRESEARYRFLAESMPQMVWTATSEGLLDYVSGQVVSYFGLSSDELLGSGWLNGVHPDDRSDVVARWQRSLSTGHPYEAEFRLRRGEDGEWRWFLVRAHLMPAASHGSTTSWLGTCTDVHEQKKGAEELRRANRELEEFAYVSSHDLQEPLRMVGIYTALILRRLGSGDSTLNEYAEFVRQGVSRMSRLLEDLLTFSRTVHTETLVNGTADLNSSLEEALSMLRTQVEESDALISIDPLPKVCGDTEQMAHVFQNLLSNALKYRAEHRRPKIHISADRNGGQWVVRVSDNGIGFEQQYGDRIFGLFKRLHKDEYPGTGLGLAICRRIVEKYGGRIWAEGLPGEGATFAFAMNPVETA